MGAQVQYILQALNPVIMGIFFRLLCLLPVGIKQQRLVRLSADRFQVCRRQFFLGEELVDIQRRPAGAEAFGPLGHHKIGALAPSHIHICIQPLQKFIGSRRDRCGQAILAHQTRRINDHRFSGINDRLDPFQVIGRCLKLLLGDNTHAVQKALDGQRIIK